MRTPVKTQRVKWWFLKFLNYAFHRCNALLSTWFSRPPNCFAYSCNSGVNCSQWPFATRSDRKLTIMYFTLPPFCLAPFLSSLFSRAFLYDHKNRKCQWLSFDRNSPGAQSQQDFNYQLYQKKGALCCSSSSLYQLLLKWRLPLSPHLSVRKKTSLRRLASTQQRCFSCFKRCMRISTQSNVSFIIPQEKVKEGQGPLSCLLCCSTLWFIFCH